MIKTGNRYYIASCVFTSKFPELSRQILQYVREVHFLETVRCCIPKYKIREFEERMPEGTARESWRALPDSAAFTEDDEIYSICHNCSNIIEEMNPGVKVRSVWELILSDPGFVYPDFGGKAVTVQDCWRARERSEEQAAVRGILEKMHIQVCEADYNHEKTDFCGSSLYRKQPPRNPRLAPQHYLTGAEGKFIPHSEEEQILLMREYCAKLPTEEVICYCHYCLEGLLQGGKKAEHLAEVLFRKRDDKSQC